VYLANLGVDPEQQGTTINGKIKRLIVTVWSEMLKQRPLSALDYLLLDECMIMVWWMLTN